MFELRPYQIRDVAAIEEKIWGGDRDVLYVLATGGGKTPVLAEVAGHAAARGLRVNVEVHRRELMRQACKALAAIGVPHSRVDADQGLTGSLVHVTSVDTVFARLERMRPWLNSVDLYIRDEAHHSTSDMRRIIRAESRRARLMGNTATPYRSDGEGLGDEFDDYVAGPSARTLTELGWLAPFCGYQPKLPRSTSMKGVRKSMGEYAQGAAAAVMMHNEITDAVVKFHVERAGRRPSIAFGVTVEHCKHITERYQLAGLRSVAIDGTMRRKRSSRGGDLVDAALKDLAQGSVDVVVSCQLIDEGLDVPRVACGIDFAPTLSTGRLLQRIGRTRRPDEEYPDALWIDAAGNLREHGMPDEVRPWSLLSGVKNLERTVARPMTCQRCRRVQPVGPLACIECGIGFVQHLPAAAAQSDIPFSALSVAIRAASRDFLLTAPLKNVVELCKVDADFRHVGQVRGYKGGWADHQIDYRRQMRERFTAGQRRRA